MTRSLLPQHIPSGTDSAVESYTKEEGFVLRLASHASRKTNLAFQGRIRCPSTGTLELDDDYPGVISLNQYRRQTEHPTASCVGRLALDRSAAALSGVSG